MEYIRQRALQRQFLAGAWCNLSNSMTVEMAAMLGYDWILVDQEHAPGDNLELLRQIQAAAPFAASVIVRMPWLDRIQFKKALDLGAGGLMIPYIETAEQAREAVRLAKYPPMGERGVAGSPRCAGYGTRFEEYFQSANDKLLTVVQIETTNAVDNVEAIAAVKGVDVLFVGPLDLSISSTYRKMYEEEAYLELLRRVSSAAASHDKSCGILLPDEKRIPLLKELGFNFIACGSDGGAVVNGFRSTLAALRK